MGRPKKGVKFWMNSDLFKICTRNTVLKIPIIMPFFEGKNMDTIVVLASRMVLSHYCGTWLLLWYLATIVILGHYCDTWPILWYLATIVIIGHYSGLLRILYSYNWSLVFVAILWIIRSNKKVSTLSLIAQNNHLQPRGESWTFWKIVIILSNFV